MAVAVVVGLLGVSSVAYGLWMADRGVDPLELERGTIMFSVDNPAVDGSLVYSSEDASDPAVGTPIQVTMPGADIAQVEDAPDGRVVLHFDVTGQADGIAGLDYDVTYQPSPDDTPGVIDTFLEGSTLKVYPASTAGDCAGSETVQMPDPDPADGTITLHHELEAAGENSSNTPVTQRWCVNVTWDAAPDGAHTNIATVSATTERHETISTTDTFTAAVHYPPVLPSVGAHTNIATVTALGENQVVANAHDDWTQILTATAADEPDLTFTLAPHVTTPESGE